MQCLFLPAIAAMNRLSYLKKFSLLWSMSLIAISIVVCNLYLVQARQTENARLELEGIALARPISQAVQILQERRGLYFGFINRQGATAVLLNANPSNAAITTAVIAMAHHLGLLAVAEGVETENQLNYLREHGCDQIQGFYFSPPVPADSFVKRLQSAKHLNIQSGQEHT